MGGKGGTLWKQLTYKLSDRRFDSVLTLGIQIFSFCMDFCLTDVASSFNMQVSSANYLGVFNDFVWIFLNCFLE